MRDKFYAKFRESKAASFPNVFSDDEYAELVDSVESARAKTSGKSAAEYRKLKRFDVILIEDCKRLIVPRVKTEGLIVFYAKESELFDVIHTAHINCGHGGRDRVEYAIKKKYKNINRELIAFYLNLCETCNKKHAHPRKGLVVKPMVFEEFNSRAQVDLIDMQANNDRQYKFIMNYQDHLTKFLILRPLKTKTAAEVAYNLTDIFCTFGAPATLQADNGREFVNQILDEIANLWHGLTVLHGKPRHSQSQGSVERANQDVEKMIYAWMEDNRCNEWSEGLRFVQFQKNNAFHRGIGQTPYEALFGRASPTTPSSTAIPETVLGPMRGDASTTANPPTVVLEDTPHASTSENNENHPPPTAPDETPSAENPEIVPNIIESRRNMKRAREKAKSNLEQQAKKMKNDSEKKFPVLTVGTNVKIPVPSVDRGKVDANNLIGVILTVSDDAFYKVGTKNGVISGLFSRNQIFPCKEIFLTVKDVPEGKEVSIRSVSIKNSQTGGQGFTFCGCKTKCVSGRCKCKAAKILCNSKCHGSTPCCNK